MSVCVRCKAPARIVTAAADGDPEYLCSKCFETTSPSQRAFEREHAPSARAEIFRGETVGARLAREIETQRAAAPRERPHLRLVHPQREAKTMGYVATFTCERGHTQKVTYGEGVTLQYIESHCALMFGGHVHALGRELPSLNACQWAAQPEAIPCGGKVSWEVEAITLSEPRNENP